jgi:hypothetical protein
LPKVLHERGYLIPAINTDSVDYVACAEQLAASIRQHHPQTHITILTQDQLPYGDLGGYANDWQCFYASPYRQTIKLEADMIAAGPIDHWWTLLEKRDVVISCGARDFYDNHTAERRYRRVFDANHLPDVYNAITYWRLSTTAQEFFSTVRNIFENWSQWRTLLKYPEDVPSTDVVYAMAATIMGVDTVTLPEGFGPSIVHMKPGIIPTTGDWTQQLVWEADPFRIQTVAQWGLVHYHNKAWRIQ